MSQADACSYCQRLCCFDFISDIPLSPATLDSWFIQPILLLMLVMLVAAAKKHFEKQVLVAGTKQSRQAIKAGRLTRLAG